MTTIVNTPAPEGGSGGGGFLIGIILLIVFAAVLLFFGIPVIRRMGTATVNLPDTQVVVPDKIDVNVTQDEQ